MSVHKNTRDELSLKAIRVIPIKQGSRIEYDYDLPDTLKPYIRDYFLRDNIGLFVELPCDARKVPDSVLAVPFIGIMLTVCMLLRIPIRVPVIDQAFYESLHDISHAYKSIFPLSDFYFDIKADDIREVSYPSHRECLFFTGGVDATSALAEKVESRPLLLNIWGGDVGLYHFKSHAKLDDYFSVLSKQLGLEYDFVKTNSREMFIEMDLDGLLYDHMKRKDNHGWWASIAHILSMATTVAPYAYCKEIGTCFIASSYVKDSCIFDSNNEKLINTLHFGSTRFVSIDGDTDRLTKTKRIIDFQKKTGCYIRLKVCWKHETGENCSNCEKCYRTIMGIVANGGDPNDYGFNVTSETYQKIRRFLRDNKVNEAFWIPIVDSFKLTRDKWKGNPDLDWVEHAKVNSPSVMVKKLLRKVEIKH